MHSSSGLSLISPVGLVFLSALLTVRTPFSCRAGTVELGTMATVNSTGRGLRFTSLTSFEVPSFPSLSFFSPLFFTRCAPKLIIFWAGLDNSTWEGKEEKKRRTQGKNKGWRRRKKLWRRMRRRRRRRRKCFQWIKQIRHSRIFQCCHSIINIYLWPWIQMFWTVARISWFLLAVLGMLFYTASNTLPNAQTKFGRNAFLC